MQNKHEGLTTDQFIITLRKLFKEASIDTTKRCIKVVFKVNNIINYSPHSCRAASTSKAKFIDVNINEIIRRHCWKNQKICIVLAYLAQVTYQ